MLMIFSAAPRFSFLKLFSVSVAFTLGLLMAQGALYAQSNVSGTVFNDANLDSTQDVGELGLAGVSVDLFAGDGAGATVGSSLQTLTSDSSGDFDFTGLVDGTYCLSVQPGAQIVTTPVASVGTICDLNVDTSTGSTGNLLGLFSGFSISGLAFDDTDNSGTQEAGEAVLENKIINLFTGDGAGATTGAVLQTVNTDASGQYSFDNLAAGTYCVSVDDSTTYKTTPFGAVAADLGRFCDIEFDATPSSSSVTGSTGNDFGLFAGYPISGSVFSDTNANSMQDGAEVGLGDISVELFQGDGSGGSVGAPIDQQISFSNGNFSFSNLPIGIYCLQVQSAGQIATTPTASVGLICDISTDILANASGHTFGLFSGFQLAGTVFSDSDNDATRDGAEAGISGKTVLLYTGDGAGNTVGGVLGSTVSASDGTYSFSDLGVGTYCTSVVDAASTKTTPSASPGTHCDLSFSYSPGASNTLSLQDLDFGLFQGFGISGTVFQDADNSGTQDAGEAGLLGRSVVLHRDDAGQPGLLLDATSTGADGTYRFEDVTAGTYCTLLIAGSSFVTTSNPICGQVLSGATVSLGDQDFGLFDGTMISGTVYADANNDGSQQPAESGLVSQQVSLYQNQSGVPGALLSSAQTDINGDFAFIDLAPGSYCLIYTPASGFASTPTQVCDLDLTGSQIKLNDQDFGVFDGFEIEGRVTDATLVSATAGADGIGGVVVSLYNDLGTIGAFDRATDTLAFTTQTNAAGGFAFSALQPGNYCVSVLETTMDPSFLVGQTDGNQCFTLSDDRTDIEFAYDRINSVLGTALAVSPAGVQPATQSGTFSADLVLTVSNLGNTPLNELDLELPLASQMPSVSELISVGLSQSSATPTPALNLNPNYDGAFDANLLREIDVLQPGQSVQLTIAMVFRPNASAGFDLSATGRARTADGTIEVDVSQNGTNPDPDGSGADNNSTPTPITIDGVEEIGAALRLVSVEPTSDPVATLGLFDVELAAHIANTGILHLSNAQLNLDLGAVIPSDVGITLLSPPSVSGDLDQVNAAYDGRSQIGLLSGSQDLPPEAQAEVRLNLRLDLRNASITNFGPYSLSTEARATAPSGDAVLDLSNIGADPTQNAGGPGVPTPLDLGIEPKVGLALALVDGPNEDSVDPALQEVTLNFTVQNTGPVPLSGVQIEADLETIFSTSVVPIPSGITPSLSAYQVLSVDPVLGAAATSGLVTTFPAGSEQLLDGSGLLPAGATGTLSLLVRWDSDFFTGPYEASATVSGQPPASLGLGRVMDVSTDGEDPDTTSNLNTPADNPRAELFDTTTSISIPTTSSLGLALRLANVVNGSAPGQFIASYDLLVQNTGNQRLDTVNLALPLATAFPTPATVVGFQTDPSANGLLMGASASNFLATGEIATAASIEIDREDSLRFYVEFAPMGQASTAFSARVTGQATDPRGNFVSDTSDNDAQILSLDSNATLVIGDDPVDGFDTDDDTPGLLPRDNPIPTDNSDPTPLLLPENPSLGVAMRVNSIVTDPSDSSGFIASVTLRLENLGNVDLDEVAADLDLETPIGAATFGGLVNLPSKTGSIALNADYSGKPSDPNGIALLEAANSRLAVGQSADINFSFKIAPQNDGFGPFTVQTLANAMSPDDRAVSDSSDDSATLVTDENANGQADETGENDVTLISLPLQTGLGVALSGTRAVRTTTPDTFGFELDVRVQNVGNTALENVQVTLDLNQAFDAVTDAMYLGLDTTAGAAVSHVSGEQLTLNPSFDGQTTGDTALFTSGAGIGLDVGEESVFRIKALFRRGTDLGPFQVSAIGTAQRNGSSAVFSDVSQNGVDTDIETSGLLPGDNPDPFNNSEPTPIFVPALLGLTKLVSADGVTESQSNPQGGLSPGSSGEFDVTFELTIQNMGGERVTNLQIEDDLAANLGAGATLLQVTMPIVDGLVLTGVNTGFDGSVSPNLLDGTASLEPGQTGTVSFTARFIANSGTSLKNAALASARDLQGQVLNDLSHADANPDANGDGDPNNDSTPTSFQPGFRALIGLAQQATVLDSGPNTNGPWRVRLRHEIENLGNVRLSGIRLDSDLRAAFGTLNTDWSMQTVNQTVGGTASNVFLNTAYTGDGTSGSINLLSPLSALEPGQTAVIEQEFTIDRLTDVSSPSTPPLKGEYAFNSRVSANDPVGQSLSDVSQDGVLVDPNGDGSVEESDATLVQLSQLGSSLTISDASANESGFAVTFDLVLSNNGAFPLFGLVAENDLGTQLGDAFQGSIGAPQFTAATTTTNLPNIANFTGETTGIQLIDGFSGGLEPGETLGIRYVAQIDPSVGSGATLVSQASVAAIDSLGAFLVDFSDDGADPASANGNTSFDDPTPLRLAAISSALRVLDASPNVDGTHTVIFELSVRNTGTQDLRSLSLDFDLRGQLGGDTGAFVGLATNPVFAEVATSTDSNISVSPNWSQFASASEMLNQGTLNRLAAQDGFKLSFSVFVNRNAEGAKIPFFTQARISGVDDQGTEATDLSDDGLSPIGNNAYGGNADPTPILLFGSGIVYDSQNRIPVAGVAVTLFQLNQGQYSLVDDLCMPPGFTNPQVTDVSGEYTVDILYNDLFCPADGTYAISIDGQSRGYENVELGGTAFAVKGDVAPPQTGLSQATCLDSAFDQVNDVFGCQIQANAALPSADITGSPGTNYYLEFVGSDRIDAKILNNHIPIDPAPTGEETVSLTKRAVDFDVSVGEVARWEITAENTQETAAYLNSSIIDFLPPGFIYREGTSRVFVNTIAVDGQEPTVEANKLTWQLDMPAKASVSITFETVIGASVPLGVYFNRAEVRNRFDEVLSPRVSAAIRIIAEPVFDCADIIGKVYEDRNRNSEQDPGEPGLGGIAVYTATGKVARTDTFGRYSFPCVKVPVDGRGSNFLLKVFPESLPQDVLVTSENPKVVRLTRGKVVRANFLVAKGRTLKMVVTDEAFEGSVARRKKVWNSQRALLQNNLSDQVAKVQIIYRTRQITPLKRRRLERLEQSFLALVSRSESRAKVSTEFVQTPNP